MSDLDEMMAAGELLIIEHGHYDGAVQQIPVVLLRPASRRSLAEAYLKYWRRSKDREAEPCIWPPAKGFRPWLIRSRRAKEPKAAHYFHTGNGTWFHLYGGDGVWPEDGG